MATSISKSQAEALAEGFFDGLGGSKDGIKPKKSLAALYQLAGGLVVDAQKNLDSSNRTATGALHSSIKVLDPRVVNGVKVVVDIELLDYYRFVDAGVKGTQSGSSSKGYAYTTKMPPVNVIRKWLIKEGIKGRQDKKYKNLKLDSKAASRRDTFRKSITETSRSVAFAIARSIQKKGLKRTNFFSKAIRTTEAKADKELSKGFKIDIINSLPSKL